MYIAKEMKEKDDVCTYIIKDIDYEVCCDPTTCLQLLYRLLIINFNNCIIHGNKPITNTTYFSVSPHIFFSIEHNSTTKLIRNKL